MGASLFANISELWYPPAARVSRGRLNEAKSPLLYASDTQHAAMWELRPSKDDMITVLEIRARSPAATPRCVIIGDLHHIDRARKPILGKGSFLTPRAFEETVGPEKYKRSIIVDRKISQWFAWDGDSHYCLTIPIANHLFRIDGLEGIVYPSAAWGGAFNVALLPKCADEKFFGMKAFVIAISDPHAVVGQCAGMCVAHSKHIASDGTIEWETGTAAGKAA